MKGWFVSLLTACFLAGVVCTGLAGLRSFRSKETAEGEAHILPSALCSLCQGSPTGVKCQTRVQARASCEAGPESGRMTRQIGGAGCLQEDTGSVCRRNLLLWEKTERPVPLDVFSLGQLRRNSSAVASRQSSTRTHLGNVHLGAVFKLMKLYLNSNRDQILTFLAKVQLFELTQLILGCLTLHSRGVYRQRLFLSVVCKGT